jgi:hypothetical protein
MRKFALLLLATCAALVAGAPARADAVRDALVELAKCADIVDAAERLKCFDAAAPRAKSALAAPAEKGKEPTVTVENFGLPLPPKPVLKAEEFGKPPPEPQGITEITVGVLEFAKTPYGKAVFILDNGQVWRQLDADSTNVLPAPPGTKMKVTVEVGFFGGYNLTIEGRNGLIKVTRLK